MNWTQHGSKMLMPPVLSGTHALQFGGGGSDQHGSNLPPFTGAIDEVRVSDIARYSADFTPPSLPFPDTTSAIVSQTLNNDHMANLFSGELSISGSTSWTIEAQLKLVSGDSQDQTVFQITRSNGQQVVWIKLKGNRYLEFGFLNGSLSSSIDVLSLVNDGNFHHFAVVFRNNYNQTQLYIDGVLGASISYSSNYNGTETFGGNFPLNMTIGGGYSVYGYSLGAFLGVIDELRLSDGGIYNANFTPPAQEFTTGITPPTSSLVNGISGITKAVSTSLTLDKTILMSLPSVVAYSYFSQIINLEKAIIVYKSTTGNEKKELIFNLSESIPVANLKFSAVAKSQFVISKITLVDFDGGYLGVASADIPSLPINL